MQCGANTQHDTTAYDFGMSSGLYDAATDAGKAAFDADDPAVKAALYALRDHLAAKADALSAETRAAMKQVQA